MPEANLNTSQSMAVDLLPLVIKEELLMIAERDTVFYDMADKVKLPEGQGRTVQFSRYERLPLPVAPLDEGETPTGRAMPISAVQAVVDQWGDFVPLSDVGIMTVSHPVLRIAQDRLGTQFAELIDREIQKTLMGGTNVFFPNGKTARSQLAPGDNLTSDVLRKVNATLKFAGAPRYAKNAYMAVVDSFVSQDVQKDSVFTQAAQYSDIGRLQDSEIGLWMGMRFKESNLIPILSLMPDVNGGANAVTTAAVAQAGGEVPFAAGTHVSIVVTRADPITGFESVISAVQDVSDPGAFCAQVVLTAASPDGIYGVYCSLESAVAGAAATLQRYVSHRAGASDTFVFFKAGAAGGAGHFVAQATGPIAPPAPPVNGNVHVSYVIGRQAFGCTELGRMQTFLTPNQASDSDPLAQRRKVGWKHMFKAVVKDSRFYIRLETTSLFN